MMASAPSVPYESRSTFASLSSGQVWMLRCDCASTSTPVKAPFGNDTNCSPSTVAPPAAAAASMISRTASRSVRIAPSSTQMSAACSRISKSGCSGWGASLTALSVVLVSANGGSDRGSPHVPEAPHRRAGRRRGCARARRLRARARPEPEARLHALLQLHDRDEGVARLGGGGLRARAGQHRDMALREAPVAAEAVDRRRAPDLRPPRISVLAAGRVPLPVVARLPGHERTRAGSLAARLRLLRRVRHE